MSSFDIAYSELKNMIITKHVTPASFITFVMAVMQVVEKSGEKGEQKKELAIALIQKIINETTLNEEDRSAIQMTIDTLLPSIIDGFVQIDHEKLFQNSVSGIRKMIAWCKKNSCCSC